MSVEKLLLLSFLIVITICRTTFGKKHSGRVNVGNSVDLEATGRFTTRSKTGNRGTSASKAKTVPSQSVTIKAPVTSARSQKCSESTTIRHENFRLDKSYCIEKVSNPLSPFSLLFAHFLHFTQFLGQTWYEQIRWSPKNNGLPVAKNDSLENYETLLVVYQVGQTEDGEIINNGNIELQGLAMAKHQDDDNFSCLQFTETLIRSWPQQSFFLSHPVLPMHREDSDNQQQEDYSSPTISFPDEGVSVVSDRVWFLDGCKESGYIFLAKCVGAGECRKMQDWQFHVFTKQADPINNVTEYDWIKKTLQSRICYHKLTEHFRRLKNGKNGHSFQCLSKALSAPLSSSATTLLLPGLFFSSLMAIVAFLAASKEGPVKIM